MAFKTYVLTDRLNVSVPIYQRVNGDQRIPIVKRNGYAPFLQITCQDKDGVSHTLRYKETSDTIFLDEQIEKKKIPANAKYTSSERNDRQFKNGTLTVSKANLQRYLEAYPGFEGSPYTTDEITAPEYMLYDKTNLSRIQNAEIRKRVKAASKVLDLNLEEAQALLIKINGSFFETPEDLEECQNMLTDFVDATDDKGLDAILQDTEKETVDEKTTVLIGKLMNAGLLSFDAVSGEISKKDKNGNWIKVREMSAEYSLPERKRLFSDFLNSNDGKLLKDDLENDLKEVGKKPVAAAKKK